MNMTHWRAHRKNPLHFSNFSMNFQIYNFFLAKINLSSWVWTWNRTKLLELFKSYQNPPKKDSIAMCVSILPINYSQFRNEHEKQTIFSICRVDGCVSVSLGYLYNPGYIKIKINNGCDCFTNSGNRRSTILSIAYFDQFIHWTKIERKTNEKTSKCPFIPTVYRFKVKRKKEQVRLWC